MAEGISKDAEPAVVLMVRVTEAPLPPGVTWLGEKEQFAPRGKLAQENLKVWPTAPPAGRSANPNEADCPAGLVAWGGFATSGPAGMGWDAARRVITPKTELVGVPVLNLKIWSPELMSK